MNAGQHLCHSSNFGNAGGSASQNNEEVGSTSLRSSWVLDHQTGHTPRSLILFGSPSPSLSWCGTSPAICTRGTLFCRSSAPVPVWSLSVDLRSLRCLRCLGPLRHLGQVQQSNSTLQFTMTEQLSQAHPLQVLHPLRMTCAVVYCLLRQRLALVCESTEPKTKSKLGL